MAFLSRFVIMTVIGTMLIALTFAVESEDLVDENDQLERDTEETDESDIGDAAIDSDAVEKRESPAALQAQSN